MTRRRTGDDEETPTKEAATMDTERKTFATLELPSDIVYVRELRPDEAAELPQPPEGDQKIYAIHDGSGARLALTDDRKLAFQLARQNDRTPVSVH
jgi:hypothetical protein